MGNYKTPKIYSVSEQIGAVSAIAVISNAYKFSHIVYLAYQISKALSLGARIQVPISAFNFLTKSELVVLNYQ